MRGFIENIENITIENENFRVVLYTTKNSQLVVMSLKIGEEIGAEIHLMDQFIRIESGEGKAILDGVEHRISDGSAVVVPAGTNHNIINTSLDHPLKLYAIYSPPNHRDKIIHRTKAEAVIDGKEHYDGKTSE